VAGISLELVRRMPQAGIPTLGVCLGHQALAQAFGGRVLLNPPVHGKATTIEHDGETIFRGLSSPLRVGRYHSLVVDPDLPDCLQESARGGGVLMALRHRELPAEGVQFHPESVLTQGGHRMLANWLTYCGTAPAESLVRQLEDEVANAVQAATTQTPA
jgi:anthranilate synthase/aminodeoxychorismate synthase-like glutamine amidotransferase